jgi:hypothetical protein
MVWESFQIQVWNFYIRVPDSTTLIFGIGSMSPAALLYDARDHYDGQSAKVLFIVHLIV